jgi:hypothetical protein
MSSLIALRFSGRFSVIVAMCESIVISMLDVLMSVPE